MDQPDPFTIVATSLGILISLGALIVALRAKTISKKVHELSERAFQGERRSLLRSRRDDQGRVFLEPLVSEAGINKLVLVFPTALQLKPIELAAPDLYFYENRVLPALTQFWDSRTTVTVDHAIVRHGQSGSIPIAVVTHGYAKGEASQSSALYDLRTTYVRKHVEGRETSNASVKGLIFHADLPIDYDPVPMLDELLEDLHPQKSDA